MLQTWNGKNSFTHVVGVERWLLPSTRPAWEGRSHLTRSLLSQTFERLGGKSFV